MRSLRFFRNDINPLRQKANNVILKNLAMLAALLSLATAKAQQSDQLIGGWQMQDATQVSASASAVASAKFTADGWYTATVPGTVLTTLVNNKVYPEPLYGENMRPIPESLNKKSYWYRSSFLVPASHAGRRTWLHFAGVNYSSEVWINGKQVGTTRGAFIRGDFDITAVVKPGQNATLAVLVSPQPHPGIPHEHNVALGEGLNGGETAIDGPTFLSTIGWDWLPAIRDRDTGIWLPVTLSSTGPVIVKDPFVTADLAASHATADLTVATTLKNVTGAPVSGTLVGVLHGQGREITFRTPVTVAPNEQKVVSLDSKSVAALHVTDPKLWWPNGYGPQNLYQMTMRFESGKRESSAQTVQFGIRKIEYQVSDSENLTISVNGVRVMVRGGNWGLDEGMKRVPRERLDAQFHMHALANMNMIRNWVGQSTNPDFYEMADKYGILLWDEFFQPNPSDGPNVTDIPTYLANVTDKVVRYRNHPSIAVWCARNEGYPPKELDDMLKAMMGKLDGSRLYQSNSADGRGVSSHGPYYWRAPRFYYTFNESFKTEVGSMSIPTIESIQGMMPERDWETINDDWAQHDMAKGAEHGDTYPTELAARFGHIRNLADFVRKGQLANYEAYRAMYEGRNALMFKTTTGIITWMSHPAQPSFVWQLYHYDLDPQSSLFAVKKAGEHIHVQLNEATGQLEVVNNQPDDLHNLTLQATIYDLDSKVITHQTLPVDSAAGSKTTDVAALNVPQGISPVYFVKLDLKATDGSLLSTNFYWQSTKPDQFADLAQLPKAKLHVEGSARKDGDRTIFTVTLRNPSSVIALMTHLQLRQKTGGVRVLPVFYSDNYISLIPGEARTVTIEVANKNLTGDAPALALDGFNVEVEPTQGSALLVELNTTAQPELWPATNLVADPVAK
ncbi:glycoside hydrolase family 2 protein [Terriglobus saanensis]|uniref:Glycoside hydrolase family 2 sugar binding protein n=1 Tax=Terriglobus saanensis (strain ATCC BAA-1853 / DSM 23119 / SP1PR4) TaxID=401053 RepID=E8V2L6_TERSS|nr:glycoside hydrolase family 2 [Terriglobus saanensis]ADV83491.1 glycoside hydrolase family 2 sugar binding protein [Terriglobus saanensis SP1PR4]